MTIDINQISGLILAGGRGTRMGSVDKGLRPFRGKPMVAHVIARLAPQVGSLMVNANQNIDTYKGFGLPVWPDQLTGFEGPLAGMQTGLGHCKTDYLVTSPCDSPFLPEDLVARLAAALAEKDAEVAVAVTGGGDTFQRHPVFCLMKTSLLPHLTDYLDKGNRKIETWYRSLRFVEVPFPDESGFRNINTIEELNRFEPT
ncbi:molybdenum cofactor guanylyltransferase MobA [Noviherbaspirillum agri]